MILVAIRQNDSFVQGVLFKLPPYSVLLNHLYDCTFFLTIFFTLFSFSVMLSSKNNILFGSKSLDLKNSDLLKIYHYILNINLCYLFCRHCTSTAS